ncbi:MAG: phosphate-binding protein [Chloroflexi bacterium]|nr:MAG: phosphate-binding protein [Chloroflexota bacterium]
MHYPLVLGLLILSLFLTGCGSAASAAADQLTLTGSTSVTPFAEQLAETFEKQHPESHINIQGLGSSAGIQAATNGTVELGMSSRQLEEDETEQLQPIEIARDALAIIIHPSNPITDLTSEQVRAIFTGSISNWSEVGGPDARIVIVTREAGSGTYGAFEELVMNKELPAQSALRQGSNGAVRQIVAEDADAIGYISLGIVDQSVKAISIDGVQASTAAVLSGQYKLVRPFLFVKRKDAQLSRLGEAFLAFVLSAEGQQELVQAGLVQGADAQ